jgi:hypothetical protein
MDPLTLIIIIVFGYFLFSSGALSNIFGGGIGTVNGPSTPLQVSGQSGQVNIPPQGYVQPPDVQAVVSPIQSIGIASAGVKSGVQVAQSAISALSTVGSTASAIGKALPIVGAAVAGILAVFQAESAKRAKQATSENSAVAAAVPGWDQNVTVIVNAYNSGQITAAQVSTAIDAIWKNYWSEVGPQIQPGRNGCQSGAVTQPSTVSFCGGSTYGAACCVGYDDLKNSNNNMKAAVASADKSGKPTPAIILPVFASKYGGINRPQYTVTFIRPH